MKKILLLLISFFPAMVVLSQPVTLALPGNLRSIYQPVDQKVRQSSPSKERFDKYVEFNWPQELSIGNTYYDKQSDFSAPASRFVIFTDKTEAAVFVIAHDTVSFSDQGTGYTYFNGSVWTPSYSRIESVSTTNPCLSILGNGELVVASRIPDGPLRMCRRSVKGTGAWIESDLPLPQGVTHLLYPKMVTSGLNHSTIHLISQTKPVANGGALFHGQDGALVYQRSEDNGNSWDFQGNVPPEMDSTHYPGFSPDCYAFAEPKGGKLAFVVGDSWRDLFLMKSMDDGVTWQKTVIWQHPYPNWNGQATDSIYCPDGSVHLAFDETGKIHVVFGITRLFSDGSQVFRFPFIGGIGHWMEGMPVWTGGDQANCLNPDSLEVKGNLACSYLQDWNLNGTIDLLWNFGSYKVGPISFPQIAFDQYGVGMLVMSSVTEAYNDNVQDYRHIWYKYIHDGMLGSIVFDWNQQPEHLFHECVFPCLGTHSPDYLSWPFIYQMDGQPGMAVEGDHDPFSDNSINKVDLNYMLPPVSVSVLISANPPDGGSVAGGGTVANGSTVTIEAHASPGWEFVDWTSQNVLFSEDSVFTFNAVWNYNLVANFRLIERIKEPEAPAISISPNPAKAFVNVGISSQLQGKPIQIQFLDMEGRRLKSISCSPAKNIRVDVQDLKAGTYTLLVETPGEWKLFRKVMIY